MKKIAPRAMIPKTAPNPGDFAAFAMPAVYSVVLPAVIETGVERSVYPSSFRSRVCSPGARPGMVAGETPRWTPSMKIETPAGVVVTEREPVFAVSVPPVAAEPVWADPEPVEPDCDAPVCPDPEVPVPVFWDPDPPVCDPLPCDPPVTAIVVAFCRAIVGACSLPA
jgi:hypothetical protein